METCVVAMAADARGALHVFVAIDRQLGPVGRHPVAHYLFSQGEMRELPPIPTRHVAASALAAASGPSGDLALLWQEDEHADPQPHPPPKPHGDALYLRRYKGGAWSDARLVSDAEASKIFPGDLALAGHADGSLDLFWADAREYHRWADLIPGGGTGLVRKTYTRRIAASGFGESTQRIQSAGRYNVSTFALMPTGGEAHDVIWSDEQTDTLKRSTRARDRWTVTETVGRCGPVSGGGATVLRIEVAPWAGEHSPMAWVCTRPGAPKTERFDDLYVSTFRDGAWQTGPPITRKTAAVKWLAGGPTGGLLLMLDATSRDRQPYPLSLLKIEGEKKVESSVVSDRALPWVLETATGPARTIHVVYAEVDASGQATLKYRLGKIVAPE